MNDRPRRRLSSAHVVSAIALFLAIGGTAAVALPGKGTVKPDDISAKARNGLMLGAVPSGKTIRGVVGADYHAADSDASDFGIDASLPRPARNALGDDDVFVNVGTWQNGGGQTTPTTDDDNPGCDGTLARPTAPAGKVCIYVAGADRAFNLEGYSARFGTEKSRYGFKLKWDASQEGDTFVDAVWAYRAP